MKYLLLFGAVLLGYFIANLIKQKQIKNISLYLAFSGAFLLSITVFELLPEVFETPSKSIGLFIMLGILLQICLEFASKGAEHGHVHLHSEEKSFPFLLFLSLSIHALLEGFPIGHGSNIMIGVIIHKIPVSIILSFFFIQAKYSKTVTILFMLLFALMTPLGSYLMEAVPQLSIYATQINALVIGIFLHVSTTILFESSKDHKFNLAKLLTIVIAIAIAYFL